MIIKFLKPLSFIPAILLMYMIYSFSAQDGMASSQLSYQVSYRIVEVGGEMLGAELQPWEIDTLATRFHVPLRKLAHMTEYFLLAVAVAFPLYVYGLRGILLLLMAGVICVGFACGDEYHQAYVAGRGPSKRDVLIDSVGVFFGIILVRIIGWTGRKTVFRPSSRRKRGSAEAADPSIQAQMTPPQGGHSYQGYQRQPYPADYRAHSSGRYPRPPYPAKGSYSQNSYRPQDDYHYERSPQKGTQDDPVFLDEQDSGTSDRLSEDMSLRKLVSDLKEQKQSKQSRHKRP